MNRIKQFFHSLVQSATDARFYRKVLGMKVAASVRFFLLSLILVTLLQTGAIIVRDVPHATDSLQQEIHQLTDQLPAETTLTYGTNGTLKISGIKLPLVLNASETLRSQDFPKQFITLSSDESANQASLLTVTPTHILSNQSQSGIPLTEVLDPSENWSLTKAQLGGKIREFELVMPSLARFIVLMSFPLLYIGMLIQSLVWLIPLSFVGNMVAWGLGVRINVRKTLQLGLHAMVPALLLQQMAHLLFATTLDSSLLIAAYLGIMILVVLDIRSSVKA